MKMDFDDALRKLGDLQRKAEMLDGEHTLTLNELFTDEFVLRHTDFESLDAMIKASGFNIESSSDFAAIPDETWDAFVKQNTRFTSWEEMKSAAAGEWVSRQLGLEQQ